MSEERAEVVGACGRRRRLGVRAFISIGLLCGLATLHAMPRTVCAQKGKAESDWYPLGYDGDTWAGEVIAFDNDQRTLTLSRGSGKNAETFLASIPDAPYQWRRDARKNRVVDFPFDKTSATQRYVYVGPGFAGSIVPEGAEGEIRVPNPQAADVITDFAPFKGRKVVVYYTPREREVNGQKLKYNDVWRIRIVPEKK